MALTPIAPGPCNNGTIITSGGTTTYSPPLRVLEFLSAGSLVVTTAAGQTMNFGSVAAGAKYTDWAIIQVNTATGTIAIGW